MESVLTVLAGLIFCTLGYYLYLRQQNDKWPKVRTPKKDGKWRNPFYFEDKS